MVTTTFVIHSPLVYCFMMLDRLAWYVIATRRCFHLLYYYHYHFVVVVDACFTLLLAPDLIFGLLLGLIAFAVAALRVPIPCGIFSAVLFWCRAPVLIWYYLLLLFANSSCYCSLLVEMPILLTVGGILGATTTSTKRNERERWKRAAGWHFSHIHSALK